MLNIIDSRTSDNLAINNVTLRDYFAAKAIMAVGFGRCADYDELWAKRAYEIADAMLKAREA